MLEKLKWTKEPPQEEGWYWIKLFYEFNTEKRIVYVQELVTGSIGALYFTDGDGIFTDGESIIDVEHVSAEWAGPIPEPEDGDNNASTISAQV